MIYESCGADIKGLPMIIEGRLLIVDSTCVQLLKRHNFTFNSSTTLHFIHFARCTRSTVIFTHCRTQRCTRAVVIDQFLNTDHLNNRLLAISENNPAWNAWHGFSHDLLQKCTFLNCRLWSNELRTMQVHGWTYLNPFLPFEGESQSRKANTGKPVLIPSAPIISRSQLKGIFGLANTSASIPSGSNGEHAEHFR